MLSARPAGGMTTRTLSTARRSATAGSAGVLLAAPSRSSKVLNGPMAEQWPTIGAVDFSTMTAPALVIGGDKDGPRHFADMGPDWHADAYTLAPGPKTLLTLFGAEPGLGGIAGYEAAETTDENPELVTALARLTAAYLHTQPNPGAAHHPAHRVPGTDDRPRPGRTGRIQVGPEVGGTGRARA